MDETAEPLDPEPALILDTVDSWIDGFFALLPNLAVAVVLLALFVAVGLGAKWSVRRSFRRRADLGQVLGAIAKWGVILAGVLVVLPIVTPSIAPGDLIAGLGLGSLAVGFAFKDILQNLVAGLIILIRQPFDVGDQIRAGDEEGTVEHIETRATKIRTYDGRRVVIPNADVFTGTVVVNTAFDARRSQFDVPVAMDDDWPRAVAVAREAAAGVEGVRAAPEPDAQAQEVTDLAKIVRVRWWTDPTQAAVIAVNGRVRLAVEGALRDAGFTLPRRTALRVEGAPSER